MIGYETTCFSLLKRTIQYINIYKDQLTSYQDTLIQASKSPYF